MDGFWAFVSDPGNQATLQWIGGGITVLAGGFWTVLTFFYGQRARDAAPAAAGGEAVAPAGASPTTRLVLLALAALGVLLIVASFSGDTVTATNGTAIKADRDVNIGTINAD